MDFLLRQVWSLVANQPIKLLMFWWIFYWDKFVVWLHPINYLIYDGIIEMKSSLKLS